MPYWARTADQGFVVPTQSWLQAASPHDRDSTRRLQHATADWEARWPVYSIAWEDALAFARWSSLRDGRIYTLPDEYQWEKGARGVDGRIYPWGNWFDATWCNAQRSLQGAMHPVAVDEYPADVSVWGLRVMGSGVKQYCLDETSLNDRQYRTLRSGTWSATGKIGARSAYRGAVPVGNCFYTNGFRLASAVALSTGGPHP